jgi:hypothetical protein
MLKPTTLKHTHLNSKLHKVIPWTPVIFLSSLQWTVRLGSFLLRTPHPQGIVAPPLPIISKLAPPVAMTVSSGSLFTRTLPNNTQHPGQLHRAMTWIPGGGFSMGAQDPLDMAHDHVGMQATEDSRPVH